MKKRRQNSSDGIIIMTARIACAKKLFKRVNSSKAKVQRHNAKTLKFEGLIEQKKLLLAPNNAFS